MPQPLEPRVGVARPVLHAQCALLCPCSFLQFCDERLASGTPTDFFDDEWRSVVAVEDIVAWLQWFIAGGVARAPGVYCMGGPERLNRVQIARAVAQARGHSQAAINSVARSSVVSGGPPSPPDISMDSDRLATVTGIAAQPLAAMLATAFTSAAALA